MAKPLLQAEKVAKRYGNLLLFDNLSFTLNQGDKAALIARNGAGKTSLLSILAGTDSPDSGMVTRTNDVTFGYFEQVPALNPDNTILEEVFTTNSEKIATIKAFEEAIASNNHEAVSRLSSQIDALEAWDTEVEIRQILSQLKIDKLDHKVGELSGGQQKRLGLAKVLINRPDVLLLDEPTNHLDTDMIEWLEEYLRKTKSTLLMVTHDRYFLDRVCNVILEIDQNELFRYQGNYSYFLDKREERINAQQAEISKARNLMRTEIEWIRRMPKARTTKSKYRVDAFDDLKERASARVEDKSVNLSVTSARIGKKILEIKHLSKSYGDLVLLKDFSYSFSRFEKVGIVGKNGTGKTTFLHLITGGLSPDHGTIDPGKTIRYGYYRQEGISFGPRDKVIDAVQKIAEQIRFDDGTEISATQMLTRFLFPPSVQYDYIEKLSGGERRRLYLCTVLMQNPNFLILDEPTNDLDILTLNVLEDYLQSFGGCVVVVSHDRFFMDKIVDHLFVFEGAGTITDFPGNYTQYREAVRELAVTDKASVTTVKTQTDTLPKKPDSQKLTFKEKRELEQLEADIALLEKQRRQLEDELNTGNLDHTGLFEKSQKISTLNQDLHEKEMRWLILSEKS